MTIKRRLFISNILMIVIPIVISLLVGICSITIIYYFVQNDGGMGLGNASVYYKSCVHLTDDVQRIITDETNDFSDISKTCSDKQLRISVLENGVAFYNEGEISLEDERLLNAAKNLNKDDSVVSVSDRSIYHSIFNVNNRQYDVYIWGYQSVINNKGFKAIFFMLSFIMIVTIIVSIVVMNKYLVKGAIRRIESPLNLLGKGVAEVEKGNLDYRLKYPLEDEFTPICEAFNEMVIKLQECNEKISHDEESRKELFAGISHDIRSPLTSVKACVDGLIEGVAQDEKKREQYLMTIRRRTDDIDRLVSQLFMLSKLELKDFPLNLTSLDIGEMLTQYVLDNKQEYGNKGLVLNLVSTQSVKTQIDIEQFLRILGNIVGNSLKYKSKEIGNVYIVQRKALGKVHILIEDDGNGVSEEYLDKLFDVFYRTDKARKNPESGSGLGLAITAKIVERMGGQITAFCSEHGGLGIEIVLREEL